MCVLKTFHQQREVVNAKAPNLLPLLLLLLLVLFQRGMPIVNINSVSCLFMAPRAASTLRQRNLKT